MASLESLSIVHVYDVYQYDSWEYNGGEKKEIQNQLILPLSPNDDQQIAKISFSNGEPNIVKGVVYTQSRPIYIEKKKEVLLYDFDDLVERYMELYWGHNSYIYDFIKADFHSCKKGQIVHFFVFSSLLNYIYA
jgi:hypothetical protein